VSPTYGQELSGPSDLVEFEKVIGDASERVSGPLNGPEAVLETARDTFRRFRTVSSNGEWHGDFDPRRNASDRLAKSL